MVWKPQLNGTHRTGQETITNVSLHSDYLLVTRLSLCVFFAGQQNTVT